MARSSGQKAKILWVLRILQRHTDEEHPMTLKELQDELERQGITAERKSLYDDFETLNQFGITVEKAGREGYYLRQEPFELAELKLLADAIQASKFITEKKSAGLIRKIQSLLSVHQAGQLQRQVTVTGRVKTPNEGIFYNVDAIHAAISAGKQIRFRYFHWALDETGRKAVRSYRRDDPYQVSPWALSWDDENYYLIAFSGGEIRHYRVDKMDRIELTAEVREGLTQFERFDAAQYAKRTFGMFGGEPEQLRIRFPEKLIGAVVDRFGQDVYLSPGEDGFTAMVKVAVSPQFFGWLFGLGGGVEILSPESARERFVAFLEEVRSSYRPLF
ncbi:MAG: WYL domain-containing protein [Oscillospiraceae bacterium]|nr:WYL domain-containing protein [Oscillospiraceae bacterium]